ncbi:hypothetical protein IRJ41_017131, partial [Triplophysa rosa]
QQVVDCLLDLPIHPLLNPRLDKIEPCQKSSKDRHKIITVLHEAMHTWHQSFKRKFKAERAPLVHDDEVKKSKEKFGHKTQIPSEQSAACHRSNSELCDEVDRMDASTVILSQRFREAFIVPKLLELVQRKGKPLPITIT